MFTLFSPKIVATRVEAFNLFTSQWITRPNARIFFGFVPFFFYSALRIFCAIIFLNKFGEANKGVCVHYVLRGTYGAVSASHIRRLLLFRSNDSCSASDRNRKIWMRTGTTRSHACIEFYAFINIYIYFPGDAMRCGNRITDYIKRFIVYFFFH